VSTSGKIVALEPNDTLDPKPPRDQFTWLIWLLAIYVVGLVIVAFFAFAANSYFGVNVTQVLSANGFDPPEKVLNLQLYAVGHHYFGDFLLDYQWGGAGNPWTNPALAPDNYPSVTNLVFKFFALFPYRVALWTFLTLSVPALLSPFLLVVRRYRPALAVLLVCLLGLLTYPVLVNLDRGNVETIMVPLYAGVAFAMAYHRWAWAAACIALAAMLKGYPVLLLLLLVPYRQWRLCAVALVGSAGASLAAFALFPGSWTRTFDAFHTAVSVFGSAAHPTQFITGNYSLTGCLMNIAQLFGRLGGNDALWLAGHPVVPGIVYLAAVTPVVLARHILPLWVRLLAALSAPQLVVPVSFGYTTVYALVIAGVFAAGAAADAPARLRSKRYALAFEDHAPEPLRIVGPTALIWAGLIAVVLTLLPAPWSANGGMSSLATIYEPLSLVAFVGVANVCLVRSLRLRRADKLFATGG
jgi:hypothetical protein